MAEFNALAEVNRLIRKTQDRLTKSRADLANCVQNIALLEGSRSRYAGYVAEDESEIAKLTKLRDGLKKAQAAASKAVTTGDKA